ncbi:molybdenum cofactor guanylyltransferase [Mucilaginibacter arboris]|uniref:Probable molybdenum cofactor guanylyltransferase n=1 Tax=Mucilaginibacter arboris TaxID=2682090 RepID=A0A7K1SY15_9SPHI|nr:NTP transferase domain-containing protein [Mucilaginibacter arboris]MVN22212.1 NTP transferase domain-containing protein [Mucilaginibacter arboris]
MDRPLKGLVLAGGRSTRMSVSKAEMVWHGKEQQYYLADLLKSCCGDVFISCRREQVNRINPDYQTIPDQYVNAGPLEAILTAFQKYPATAWMVIACDLPLMDLQTLKFLKKERDELKIATVFENQEDGLPEPLIGIWEPESYELLKMYQQKEHLSLRKILIKHGAKIIKAPETDALMNANTPEDAKRIAEVLSEKASFNR